MLKLTAQATVGAILALALLIVLTALVSYLAQFWYVVALAAITIIAFCIALIKTITHEMRKK